MREVLVIDGELPDTNQVIAEAQSNRYKYGEMKATNTQLVTVLAKNQIKNKYGKIDIEIVWICKNKMKDKDNIIGGTKFILDGLVNAGTIENDGWRHIGNLTHKFQIDGKNPRIEVRISEVNRVKDLKEEILGNVGSNIGEMIEDAIRDAADESAGMGEETTNTFVEIFMDKFEGEQHET